MISMSNYSNGAARERRIMHKLEKEGWYCIRSAGSHGIVDIFAMKVAGIIYDKPVIIYRFIQSKRRHYLNPKERKEKEEFEHEFGVTIEVL